jgi:hypothetical protein
MAAPKIAGRLFLLLTQKNSAQRADTGFRPRWYRLAKRHRAPCSHSSHTCCAHWPALAWSGTPWATRPRSRWALGILRTFRPKRPLARTLVQDILRCWWGWPNLGSLSLGHRQQCANTIVIISRLKGFRRFSTVTFRAVTNSRTIAAFYREQPGEKVSPFQARSTEQALGKRALVLRLFAQSGACSSRTSTSPSRANLFPRLALQRAQCMSLQHNNSDPCQLPT